MQLMKRLVLGIGAFLCSVALVFPQGTATIVGTVADPSGGVIPGASITVSSPERGLVRHVTTDSAGSYQVPALPLGDFVVTVEASGFRESVVSGIHLEVGLIRRVDVTLQLGQATQKVEVVGNIPQVQTETATISDVVTSTQTSALELNGRNFFQLATLVPGAVADNSMNPEAVGVSSNNNISFNGAPLRANNWQIDGSPNTDEGNGDSFVSFPSLDSIAEFRVNTANYDASQGRTMGAQIEVVTKSGTKQFHGDLYDYNRNDHLDANSFFVNRSAIGEANAPKVPLIWNNFGWTLGGPVYIPNHYNQDKSKTYFFVAEEWRKYRQGSIINAGTPTVRMRSGDFSECDPSSSNYNPIVASGCTVPKNPATGKPYTNDIVPQDPNSLAILNEFFPLPNTPPDKYVAAPSLPMNWREDSFRVDQNISDKMSLFVRYTQDAWEQDSVPMLWTGSSYDTLKTTFLGPGKTASLHIANTISPTVMNEWAVGYSTNHLNMTSSPGPSNVAGTVFKPADWTVKSVYPGNQGQHDLPTVFVNGGLGFSSSAVGEDPYITPWHNSCPVGNMRDNFSYLHGNHSIKTGFYLEYWQKNEQEFMWIQGQMYFNTGASITTGNGLADMYLGNLQQYTESGYFLNGVSIGGKPERAYRQTNMEPYVQDTWKARKNLSIMVGMRIQFFGRQWERTTPTLTSDFEPGEYSNAVTDQLNAAGQFIPGSGLYDATEFGNGLWRCGTNSLPIGCSKNYMPAWAPRLGFSWDPTGHGKTVLRGGFGVYYDAGNGNSSSAENIGAQAPVVLTSNSYNLPGYSAITPGALTPGSIEYMPYNQKWSHMMQFSLGVQHQLSPNDLATLGFVGSLGRDLATESDFNQVPNGATTMNVPALAGTTGCDSSGNCNVQQILINNLASKEFFEPYREFAGGVTTNFWGASSHYTSLQASYRHTASHGLTFGASYTWGHLLDNQTNPLWDTGVDDSNKNRWWGTSDINRTQVLQMNFVYQLPFFRNSSSHFLRSGIGGWEFSGIASMFSGEPIWFTCGVNGFSSGIGKGVMCNSAGPLKITKGTTDDPLWGPTATWFNPNNITQPLESQLYSNGEPGMFGYLGRNVLTGPGRNNWDLALHKDFRLPWWGKEGSTLQFRWETFNSFNHTQWNGVNVGCSGAPNSDGTPAFGRPCGGNQYNLGNGEVNSTWEPRVMQFALKFSF
jgi:hypothetical protein